MPSDSEKTKPNKANLPDDQMNVNKVLTMDYENKSNCKLCESKANTKPTKANFRKAKMNVTTFLTKEYENISNCSLAENKPNTKPIQTQLNPILSAILSVVALAKTEALAKADSNPARSNLPKNSPEEFFFDACEVV